ncbi:cell division protein ZipA [Ferrimonas marina]|uniref:Cell division protein ZipA n=1 Tax=Ferrimonas marina TaxID=299255 RepID=A0A1M5YVR3_9GAMM|nr:cell division protein ZipA [Ferrimonas marina]SHI16049.1 cell division protein ZipA [Ferrimonas marina]
MDMRIVFIVVGLLAIVGLCVHGFWSLRRNSPDRNRNRRTSVGRGKKRMAKIEPSPAPQPAPLATDDDVEGIVSPARVVSRAEPQVNNEQPEPFVEPEPVPTPMPAQQSLLDEEPEAEPAPVAAKPRAPRSRASRKEPTLGSEQIELGLEPENTPVESEEPAPALELELEQPSMEPVTEIPEALQVKDEQEQTEKPELAQHREPEEVDHQPTDVLVLHVVGDRRPILGEELLPNLTTLGFKFGEMDIFHRHQSSAGTGPVLFSLANMVKPGTFDPDNMEQFTTEGVALFMTLPAKGDAKVCFSIMLGAAQNLAELHGAKLLDDQRNEWDDAAHNRYLGRIKAAERVPA